MSTDIRTRLAWPRLGLGTGTLASLGRAASTREVDVLMGAMLDLGLTVIDTADTYGSGDCERLLGKVLSGRRQSFTLITKAGYRHSNLPGPLRPLNQFAKKGLQSLGLRQCFTPAYISKCLDNSLERLKTESVDAFLLHDPPLEAVTNEDVMRLFDGLKRTGKTRTAGVSSSDSEVLNAAISSGVFDVIQTPASLKAAVTIRPLWRECEARHIQLIGSHIFDPSCLGTPGVTHEMLMRGSSALLPKNAVILCGTRKPSHLSQSKNWALDPLPEAEAERLVMKFSAQG